MALLKWLVFALTFCEQVINLDAKSCPKGQFVAPNKPGGCAVCPAGFYQPDTNESNRCKVCRRCDEESGSYALKECTAETNRECSCRGGFLRSDTDFSTCKCDIGNGKQDRECLQCQDGYFNNRIDSPCKRWKTCSAGVNVTGTKVSDVICNAESKTYFTTTTMSNKPSHEGTKIQKKQTVNNTTTLSATSAPRPRLTPQGKMPTTRPPSTDYHIGSTILLTCVIALLVLTAVIYKLLISPGCSERKPAVQGCGERQHRVDGRCCDLCPPGTYVEKFCSQHRQTICTPCKKGTYSDQYHILDTCEECQSCQEYTEKCTPTTNANCSCRPDFLCSNSVCSKCEENKCVTGERPKRTDKPKGKWLIEYSYQCEPLCPDTEYFDVKKNVCKPLTQCSVFGLAERFPGNKTHNSVCEGERPGNGGDFVYVILSVGFVFLSLTLLIMLSYVCVKNLRKHKQGDKPSDLTAPSTNTSDFHLSKEESGLQLISQDNSKHSDSFCDLQLESLTD
ncbi:tumor necrosis factor receptor superfamily member 18 [Xyrichtys novacula]|uniref:Tumor necrosis factor receptor superfamily member 18 n=1 Tax=Xyrichtys novacula TaxID=13765 RepID=A0AAV1EPS2_XYRNO|nr:tumor necrosis factor receptor superfamily member 18 [Xyrichtys novacula]